MFGESIDAVLKGAESKLGFMKSNPLGYFMASAIAGMFITFGSMISMSIGGYLTALMGPAAKIGAAIAFAAALSMVITAGCELFTGNNLTVGMLGIDKPRRWGEIAGLWAYCWLGNLVGSWITIAVYHYAGADTVACVSQYFAKVSASKVSFTPPSDGPARHPLQRARLPCRVVRGSTEGGIRQADHDRLVHPRLHGLRLRALGCQHVHHRNRPAESLRRGHYLGGLCEVAWLRHPRQHPRRRRHARPALLPDGREARGGQIA